MKTLLALLTISIMGFHTAKDGSLRLTVREAGATRSATITKDSQPYNWFRLHVSRRISQKFGETDAETVSVTFTGDTIREVR